MDLSQALWTKSSHSNVDACVEVAFLDGQIAVRNSRDQMGPSLLFNSTEWKAFLNGVRDGEFDLPGA